jgi:bacterial/archaeal transporter family protein
MAQWIIYALLSAIFAALTAIFSKVGLKGINSDLATAIRTAVILVLTWSIVLFRSKVTEISTLSKSNWIFLILSAVATGLSWLFYYRALQSGPVAAVNALDKTSLLFVIILSLFFLKEPVTSRMMIGVGLILIGTIVLVYSK